MIKSLSQNESMARKLIKYGKFLMSVALIFCLMAPSYASLSASDGSAFVTKGEFDSVLSDFNARLTTFEAGINSKIDSQVTSYLDRNGIWAGSQQTYKTAVLGYTGISATGTETWGTYWYNDGTGWKNFQAADGKTRKTLKYYDGTTTDVIDKITKSGLLLLQIEGLQQNNSDARRGIYVMSGNAAGGTGVLVYADNQTLNFTENIEFYQIDNSVSPAITEMKSGLALPHIIPVPGVAALSDYPKSFIKFFVKKDTKLQVKFSTTLNVIAVVGGSGIYTQHAWYVRSAIVY